MRARLDCFIVLTAVVAGAIGCGCPGRGGEAADAGAYDDRPGDAADHALPPPAPAVTPEMLSHREFTAYDMALQAQQKMFRRLLEALTTALKDGGPAAAIAVCRDRAPIIAAEVGQEQGVVIGRTSFRVRNSANAPPRWTQPIVRRRYARPAAVVLAGHDDTAGAVGSRLGVMLPIMTGDTCLTCHGPTDTLSADVRAALAAHYPHDRATGFRAGDLRGWFWVEAPLTDRRD